MMTKRNPSSGVVSAVSAVSVTVVVVVMMAITILSLLLLLLLLLHNNTDGEYIHRNNNDGHQIITFSSSEIEQQRQQRELPWTNNNNNYNKKSNNTNVTSSVTTRSNNNTNINNTNMNDMDDTVTANTVLITVSVLNTIFFVIPTTIRYAMEKRQCLRNYNKGIIIAATDNQKCICTYEQLVQTIQNNYNYTSTITNRIPVFILCPAITIQFQQPINITKQIFRLSCGTSRYINTQPCILTPSSTTTSNINFFIGTPIDVTLQDITIHNGYNINPIGGGSAIEVIMNGNNINNNNIGSTSTSSSKLTLQNVIFQNNTSTARGGTIYVKSSSSSLLLLSTTTIIEIRGRTIFRNNNQVRNSNDDDDNDKVYNDIYIVPKKTFFGTVNSNNNQSTIYVDCIPTTLLDQPRFCNFNDDINLPNKSNIIIEGVTDTVVRTTYTNCFNRDIIDTSC